MGGELLEMRSDGGATEEAEEEEEEPGVSEQKQKPHTKMWGIRKEIRKSIGELAGKYVHMETDPEQLVIKIVQVCHWMFPVISSLHCRDPC